MESIRIKKLLLLGASGSIGQQAIEILKNRKDIELVSFSVGNNDYIIDEILNIFNKVQSVYLNDPKKAIIYQNKYPNIKFFSSNDGILNLIKLNNYDFAVNALSGLFGLKPTLSLINLNKDILLANKESLVCAGDFVINEIKKRNLRIIPIDSEHSAILKCFKYAKKRNLSVEHVFITASGGPFFNKNKDELKLVTKKEALNHPTWSMGKKITIDSATMVNKTFEIIEAHYLFDINFDEITPIIDRKSYVHSYCKLSDGQLCFVVGNPTMLEPIRFAFDEYFNYEYDENDIEIGDEEKYNLTPFDFNRFDIVQIAKKVIENKKDSGLLFTIADDILVEQFLNDELKFFQITEYIDIIINGHIFKEIEYESLNEKINSLKEEIINTIKRREL